MKFTTIISVAIALCVVSTNAAPVSTTKVSGSKATTTPTPPPKARDPCADLAAQGKNSDSILKFNTVRDCYRAQTFKPEVAEKILTSVESAIGNFYAFIDNAKEAHGAPFKTPRVDLLAELKKIRRTKWKNDYDFNMALTYLTFSANDGHLAYR
ncbi:hypothetical protein BX616_006280, partial [Lobosporangium transversale]